MERVTAPVEQFMYPDGESMDERWWIFFTGLESPANGTLPSVIVDDLTPNRLVASDASKQLVSVAALSSWISGTANEVEVTDNGDGTITVGLPNDVSITNDLSVLNDFSVSNDAAVGNDLSVANDATIENDATINNNVYIKADKKLYFDNN